MKAFKVLIAGTFQESDAYPNVKHRVRLIEQSGLYEVVRYHEKLSPRINYHTRWQATLSLIKLAVSASIKSISVAKAISRNRYHDVTYLPYPATLILWIVSFLPKSFRPRRLVVDLFISLYDTVIIDRQLFDKNGVIAWLLLRFEKRALKAGNILLTDTPENADYYALLFSIDRSIFTDIPLSIDNCLFSPNIQKSPISSTTPTSLPRQVVKNTPQHDNNATSRAVATPPYRILYVGTFVPLHNIGLLTQVIREFKTSRSVEFIIVGNGQDAPIIEQLFRDRDYWPENVSCIWESKWQDSKQIEQHIRRADLCIGLLGTDGKSQRVWPIKNYLYMACGKPLITAKTPVCERLINSYNNEIMPFITVDPKSVGAVHETIASAIMESETTNQIAESAARYHEIFHSDIAVFERLHSALTAEP